MIFMQNFKTVSLLRTSLVQLNRAFSTSLPSPVKVYENAQLLRKIILQENKDKAGVYM